MDVSVEEGRRGFALEMAVMANKDRRHASAIIREAVEFEAYLKESPVHEHFDENTLGVVRETLMDSGFVSEQADEVIRVLLNRGILFRERV